MDMQPLLDPLLVPQPEAMRLLGVRSSKYFAMKKAKLFECVEINNRDMVVYASLKKLTQPKVEADK